jgi:hypothetical protein
MLLRTSSCSNRDLGKRKMGTWLRSYQHKLGHEMVTLNNALPLIELRCLQSIGRNLLDVEQQSRDEARHFGGLLRPGRRLSLASAVLLRALSVLDNDAPDERRRSAMVTAKQIACTRSPCHQQATTEEDNTDKALNNLAAQYVHVFGHRGHQSTYNLHGGLDQRAQREKLCTHHKQQDSVRELHHFVELVLERLHVANSNCMRGHGRP